MPHNDSSFILMLAFPLLIAWMCLPFLINGSHHHHNHVDEHKLEDQENTPSTEPKSTHDGEPGSSVKPQEPMI